MNKLIDIWSLDLRRYRGVPVIALLFITVMPLLYGGIYLDANWDLYGNINKVNVAIVDEDEPVTYQGKMVDAGAQFEEALKNKDGFNWQFIDSEDEAIEQLKDGKVYMIVTVPSTFSSNLVSAGQFKPERATITFHRDDANGFIAGSLLSQAESVIQESVNAAVGEAYFSAMFGQLSQIRDGFEKAANGSQDLADGLKQATDGIHTIDTQLKTANVPGLDGQLDALDQALSTLDQGSAQALSGLSGISGAITQLSGVSSTIDAGTGNVETALGPLRGYVNSTLPDLQDNAAQLATITSDLQGGANGGLVGQTQNALKDATDLVNEAAANPMLWSDPSFTQRLQNALGNATNLQAGISGKVNAQGRITSDIQAAINYDAAKSAVDAADAALGTVRGTVQGTSNVLGGIGDSAQQLKQGMDTLQSGRGQLNAVAQSLGGNSLTQALSGVTALIDGLGRLDQAMPLLEDGANTLNAGLASGAAQIPALTAADTEKLASIMSSPVDVKMVVDNDAGTYGRGLAPFFFSIAIWVGTVTYYLVMRTLSGRAAVARASTLRTLVFGFGTIMGVGLVGSLLMGYGVWLWLGLNPVHGWLYLLLLLLVPVSFFSLGYAVRLLIGAPQSAVFLVWLILQLPASGGTFPVAMLQPFYQALSIVSPMRYSVDAFRVVISGGTAFQYWGSVAVLFGIAVLSLAASYYLVHKRKQFRMRDLHPPMITSASTGDYSFSVRPR